MTDYLTAAQLTRRPYNRVLTLIGANAAKENSGDLRHRTSGAITYAKYLGGQRFIHDPRSHNFGVDGETSTQILARLNSVLAASDAAHVMAMGCFENDFAAGLSLATALGNMAAIEAAVLNAGRLMTWITEYPRGESTTGKTAARYTADQQAFYYPLRREMMKRRSNPGVFVVDSAEPLADKGDNGRNFGDILFGATTDGVRLTWRGGFYLGQAINSLMTSIYPHQSILPISGLDAWSSTNPNGLLTANPYMSGSNNQGGTGNPSGAVADSWFGQPTNGSTGQNGTMIVTHAKVSGATSFNGQTYAREKSKDWQQGTFSGTPTGQTSFAIWTQDITASKIATGNILRAVAEMEIDACANIASVGLYIWDKTAGVLLAADLDTELNGYPSNEAANTGVALTPPTLGLTSAQNNLALQIRAKPQTAGNAVSGAVRVRGAAAWTELVA